MGRMIAWTGLGLAIVGLALRNALRPFAGWEAFEQRFPDGVHLRIGMGQQVGSDSPAIDGLSSQWTIRVALFRTLKEADRVLGLAPANRVLGLTDVEHCQEMAGRQEIDRAIVDGQSPVGNQDRRCPDHVQWTDHLAGCLEQMQLQRDETFSHGISDVGIRIRIGVQPIASSSGVLENIDQDRSSLSQRLFLSLGMIMDPIDWHRLINLFVDAPENETLAWPGAPDEPTKAYQARRRAGLAVSVPASSDTRSDSGHSTTPSTPARFCRCRATSGWRRLGIRMRVNWILGVSGVDHTLPVAWSFQFPPWCLPIVCLPSFVTDGFGTIHRWCVSRYMVVAIGIRRVLPGCV